MTSYHFTSSTKDRQKSALMREERHLQRFSVGYNEGRDSQLQKLSEFNKTLAPRVSTWKKFQWEHLLSEKPAKPTMSMENDRLTYSTVVSTVKNDGFSSSREMGNDGFGQKPVFSKSSAMSQFQDYRPVRMSPNDIVYIGPNAGSGRVSIVDSIVDKIYGTDSCSRDGIREFSESRIMGCDQGISPTSSVMERDGEDLGSRICHVEYEQDHGFERGSGLGCNDDSFKRLLEHDQDMYETEGTHEQTLTADELREQDLLQKMLKRKLMFDLMISENSDSNVLPHDQSLSNDEIHDSSYGDEQWTNEDIQQLPLSKSPGHQHSPVERVGWISDDMFTERIADSDDWLPSPDFPASMQQNSSKPVNTSGRNIKKRLGPARRDIKERLGPASRDIKKRLGPAQNTPKSNPWVKNLLQNKSLRKNLNDVHECLNVQGGGSSKVKAKRERTQIIVQVSESPEVKAKHLKTEPSGDSGEFKQQLHINFLKFVKALNENSALRRKYTEQGRAGTLRCSVCGSNSKDFMDTLSLAQHAFASRMVGSRAEHLGFHKALCTLMGWNSTAALNSPWVREILPDGEALALKEDLIIWPPVVVVHNSSIANCNPDERMIVSTEELSAILRGMGFDRGMAKVCHGRPANQSTMVVSFQGTFSGLEEAERLHKFYAENKYGRAEFKQMNFSSSNSIRGTQIVPVEKVGNILYGYLGIADDLDKLDFGTKVHSVVKSKKDIQAIADAPLHSK